MIKPEVLQKAKALAEACYIDAIKFDAIKFDAINYNLKREEKMTTPNAELIARLRMAIIDIRRKPYPISDIIPMLLEAADALEQLTAFSANALISTDLSTGNCKNDTFGEGSWM
jgi:hypothetical protein